jgi:hypothetical protein
MTFRDISYKGFKIKLFPYLLLAGEAAIAASRWPF